MTAFEEAWTKFQSIYDSFNPDFHSHRGRLVQRMVEVEDRILSTPSASYEDVVIKLRTILGHRRDD